MLRHRHTLTSFLILFAILSALAAQTAFGDGGPARSGHRHAHPRTQQPTRLHHGGRHNRHRHVIYARCARHTAHVATSCTGHAASNQRSRKQTKVSAHSGATQSGSNLPSSGSSAQTGSTTQHEGQQPAKGEGGSPAKAKEAPEELNVEEVRATPKLEEAPTVSIPKGPQINAAPTGPPVPAGGWHIAFGDAFGAKIGYGPGEDNFWFTNKEEPADTDQPGLNSNELEVFNSNAVKVGPEGLELTETYTPNAGGTGKNYVGGLVNTAAHASGQQPFSWKSGGSTTWAFECVCKWPQNTGEADPGWWSDATVNGQENEIDFFEGFGWGKTWHTDGEWSASMPTVVGLNYHTVYGMEKLLGFDPTEGFHRYTTTLTPNGSKTIVAEYVDGKFQWSFEVEYPANRQTFAHLILSYALREFPEGFQSGTRSFVIRSVAVYQDGAHAGQEIQGGGIAPGTVVG